MKYKIVVLKKNESLYLAYCPLMPDMRAMGGTMDLALSSLMREFLCYLHDAKAEFEIITAGNSVKRSPHALQSAFIAHSDAMVRK